MLSVYDEELVEFFSLRFREEEVTRFDEIFIIGEIKSWEFCEILQCLSEKSTRKCTELMKQMFLCLPYHR